MARPRLNRNGLWARIFGKNRKEIAKVEKNCRKIVEIFQKIVEIFQKIAKIFQKIVEKFQKNCKKFQKKFWKTYENSPKPSPPTYKSARNPKKFSSRTA